MESAVAVHTKGHEFALWGRMKWSIFRRDRRCVAGLALARQHDLRPQRQCRRQRARPRYGQKMRAFVAGNRECRLRASGSHRVTPSIRMPETNAIIMPRTYGTRYPRTYGTRYYSGHHSKHEKCQQRSAALVGAGTESILAASNTCSPWFRERLGCSNCNSLPILQRPCGDEAQDRKSTR